MTLLFLFNGQGRPGGDDPRPAFVSLSVDEPVLLVSLAHAIETLGEGEGGQLAEAFRSNYGVRGIWALPHPDCQS